MAFLLLMILIMDSCKFENRENAELEKLKSTIEKFYTAVNSGDTDKRLSLFTNDAIIMPNGGEFYVLNDSMKAVWKNYDEKWIFRIKDIEHIEITVSGKTAYTVNTYYYTFHKKDSEAQWHKTKNVHIWKKQDDGSWKLHVDIWNSSSSEK